jgi:hypothetical protein
VAKSQLVLLAMMPSSLLLADQLDSFLWLGVLGL